MPTTPSAMNRWLAGNDFVLTTKRGAITTYRHEYTGREIEVNMRSNQSRVAALAEARGILTQES